MGILCQVCKSAEATVHVTDIAPANGEKRERHLCESCAEEEGITMKQHEPINTILAKFVKQKTGSYAEEVANLTCPKCGLSFREFRASGLFGCLHDYEVFGEYIAPLIERAHGGATHHVGKAPRRVGSAPGNQGEILRLKRQLTEAVKEEDYETAAAVRDQLKVLQGDGN